MRSLTLGKHPIQWMVQTFRAKGPVRAFKVMWHVILDSTWDLVHGTETLTRIDPRLLETDSDNKRHATSYGATRARPLMRLFTQLGLSREGGFVDFGAGKGRVVMIAAHYGFRKVIGIEFSESLCHLARKNVAAFSQRRKVVSDVSIVHSDVIHYAIQSDETTFFLYDPFGAEVLTQLLENLCRSVMAHPREIRLIYNSPRHHDVMERCGLFTDRQHFDIGGNEFCVYANAVVPARG